MKWCSYEWESCMEGGRIIHPANPYMWYSEECVSIDSDNTLRLTIKEDPRDITYWDGSTYHSTMAVGIIRSVDDFDYGTFSAYICCPEGYNLWPSFWLSGSESWPPEIDIMEAWSEEDDYFKWFRPQFPYLVPSWTTTTNVHYNKIEDNEFVHDHIGSKNMPVYKQWHCPTNNFINYECIWEPDKIRIKVNGFTVRKVGRKISNMLTDNIKPGSGHKMNVIFNVWHEDPAKYKVNIQTDMLIRNFTYKAL